MDPPNQLWREAVPNAKGQFEGGYLPYSAIIKYYLVKPNFIGTYDTATQTPYSWSETDSFFLAYEDSTSLFNKVKYAARKNFAGVMIWAVDLDDTQNTLLRTVSSNVLCSTPPTEDCPCPSEGILIIIMIYLYRKIYRFLLTFFGGSKLTI